MRIAIRPAVLRNLIVLVTLVFGTLALLYFSRPVSAANKFWIASAPGTFSVNTNWSTSSGGPANTTAPGPADLAIFDGNGLGNCTITVDTTVTGIQINAGYATGAGTGTISPGTSNLTVSGEFTQADGTFTGGSGVIDFNGHFTLSGGTFTASSTTTSFALNFTQTGGTFAPNGGTVVFDSGGNTFLDVPTSLTLNNVTVDKAGAAALALQTGGDTLIVAGTLGLTDGVVNGVSTTIEAQGDVLIAPTFNGGNAGFPLTLLISGGATRTVTLPAGVPLPGLRINAPNVTVNTSGAGAITFIQPLNIQNVASFTNGTVDFIFSTDYTHAASTFTGGSGAIDFNGNFILSGGTFTASSTNTFFALSFTQTGGTFAPNGGTVVFDSFDNTFLDVPTSLTLNNVTVDKAGAAALALQAAGDTLIVIGTLTLTDGVVNGVSTTLEARGNVLIASTFNGGITNFPITLLISGATARTVTLPAGVPLPGLRINAPNVTVNTSGAGAITFVQPVEIQNVSMFANAAVGLIFNTAFTQSGGTFTGGSGTINFNNAFTLSAGTFTASSTSTSFGAITIGTSGILRNFGGGDLTLGGNVSNSGIININGGGTGCGDPNGADPLQIRSTLDTTVRTWSGTGTFSLVDVDVNSQAAGTPPGAIVAFGSSILGPNMGAGWTLNSGCPFEINSQPTNQTACLGSMASFSVGATGIGLSFQWRRAGTPLSNGGNISIVSGPNSSTLTINPVGAGDAASYDVVVSSSLGLTATSNTATLSLLSPPAITTNPVNTNACEGATASFTAAANGNPTPTVQWQVSTDGGANFSNISGATSTTLSFTASASQNGNRFRAVFTNSCNNATTTAATLTVNAPDLAIDKSHTGDFTVGTNGVYTITVTNAGACSTTGTISVTDNLPNGLSLVSGIGTGWSCLAAGQAVTCTNVVPLAASASTIITMTVGVAQAAVPTVTNTATVSTPNDGNASNNSDSDPTTVNGAGGTVNAGQLIISEFRLRGPGPSPTPNANQMASDEFVEIYNNTNTSIIVQAVDGSAGFAVATADGVARCVIPNATTIPARGHFLCVNSVGYSLSSYPAGNRPQSAVNEPGGGTLLKPKPVIASGGRGPKGITPPSNAPSATGDANYTLDIPDNAGIALFRTANPANFNLTNRLDAVGSTSEANPLFKEGAGYPALTSVVTVDHSFYRSLCSFVAACTTPGIPKDTDTNSADFLYVSTDAIDAGAGRRMGAPGPENLGSPIKRDATVSTVLLDATTTGPQPPNRARDLTPDPGNNSTFGTMSIRRRVTNNTGANVTRLRFRIIEITTLPAPSSTTADIRARTSPTIMGVSVNDAATCAAKAPPESAPCVVDVVGLALEQPPNQPNGGGFNSTLSAGTITLATPLANGASVNVNFLFGVQQTGTFRVLVILEALP